MSSSVEISAIPLNHAVTIFRLTAHALHLIGSQSMQTMSQKGKVFFTSIIFYTPKNERFFNFIFTHIKLFDCQDGK